MQEPAHQVPENQMSKRPGSGVWNGRANVHQPVPAQLGHVLQGSSIRASRKLHSAERGQLPRRMRQYRRRRTGVRKRWECLQVRILFFTEIFFCVCICICKYYRQSLSRMFGIMGLFADKLLYNETLPIWVISDDKNLHGKMLHGHAALAMVMRSLFVLHVLSLLEWMTEIKLVEIVKF